MKLYQVNSNLKNSVVGIWRR